MQQRGFTLIELIMVIVMLGVLSAVALPKFVDLGSDARTSVVQSLQGSMASANTLILMKSTLAGTASSASATVALDGSTTIATKYGYASSAYELIKALNLGAVCANAGACADETYYVNATNIVLRKSPAWGNNQAPSAQFRNCAVNYTAAADASTPPAYLVNTSLC